MNVITLCCTAVISLSSILGISSPQNISAIEQTTKTIEYVPYKMQPATVIVYDNNCKGNIIKGGMIDLYEQEIQNKSEIEIIPNMKAVYNEITGDIDNIYYTDSFCKEYTIHGERNHLYQKAISLKYHIDACSLFFAFGLQRPMYYISHIYLYGDI